MNRAAKCPTCRVELRPGSDRTWMPFCSERCQLIDLGAWITEQHRIPSGEPADPEYEDEDPGLRH